jgi:DNA-binding FadR family transcriptional regulator
MATEMRPPAPATRTFRVPKTAELVATYLRNQIVRGELVEGDSLPPEAELMTAFGVSRPTLREAFRILESESLITIRRGARGGARVHGVSATTAARYAGLLLQARGTTIADLFQCRVILEPVAARMLAELGSRTATATLRRVVEEQEEAVDPPAVSLAAARFHEQLLALAGNTTLAVLAGMLTEIIDQHAAAALDREPRPRQAARMSAAVHLQLVELIDAGKGDEAETFWRDHLGQMSQSMLKGLGNRKVLDLLT